MKCLIVKTLIAIFAMVLFSGCPVTPPSAAAKQLQVFSVDGAGLRQAIPDHGTFSPAASFPRGLVSTTLSFEIVNSGSETAALSGTAGGPITVAGREAACFWVSESPGPITLAPGAACTFRITFSHRYFGANTAEASIAADLLGGAFVFTLAFDVSGTLETIEENHPVSFGEHTALAADAQGFLHVVYNSNWYDNELRYATNQSGAWVSQTVDAGSLGAFCDIAVDGGGFVHLAYYDQTYTECLTYATNKSGAWVHTTLFETGNLSAFGADFHIVLDAADAVHIAFWNQKTYRVRFATNASGAWAASTFEDAAAPAFRQFGFAIDAQGYYHLLYLSTVNYDVRYATNRGGSWHCSTIDNAGDNAVSYGWFPAVETDEWNHAHLAYRNEDRLVYATNESGDWVRDTITGVMPFYISLTVNSIAQAYIAFTSMGDLYYATNRGGYWKWDRVEQFVSDTYSGALQFPSICVTGASPGARIAYHKEGESKGLHLFSE